MAVENLGTAVDTSVAQMSALMVKCQQISDSMPPVENLMIQMCVCGSHSVEWRLR